MFSTCTIMLLSPQSRCVTECVQSTFCFKLSSLIPSCQHFVLSFLICIAIIMDLQHLGLIKRIFNPPPPPHLNLIDTDRADYVFLLPLIPCRVNWQLLRKKKWCNKYVTVHDSKSHHKVYKSKLDDDFKKENQSYLKSHFVMMKQQSSLHIKLAQVIKPFHFKS